MTPESCRSRRDPSAVSGQARTHVTTPRVARQSSAAPGYHVPASAGHLTT